MRARVGQRRWRVGTACAALSLGALAPDRARAQPAADPVVQQAPDTARACRRCLGGHRFLVSGLVPDPFVTTHFRNGTGVGGATDLTVPIRNLQGAVVDSLSASIGFLLLDFEYQWAATRWLALRGTASALARSGTSSESVLASGASALYGGSVGVTAQVWQGRATQIALTADARRNQAYGIDPYGFAAAIADGASLDAARDVLVRTVSTNRYTGGVRAAWAPARWLGLNALYEAGVGRDPERARENQSVQEFGALAGFDARQLWHVPVGLWLGWRDQRGAGRVSELAGTQRTTGFGVLYTGRPHYLVGVDASIGRLRLAGTDVPDLHVRQLRLVTRFDF